MKTQRSVYRSVFTLGAIASLAAACAATPPAPPPPPVTEDPDPVSDPVTQPDPAPVSMMYGGSGHAAMDAWRNDFSARAVAMGHNRDVVFATLKDISPLSIYLGSEVSKASSGIGDQAEFAKPIWEYVESAVSESRKSRGADKLLEFEQMFEAIEAAYGVDREALTAIWAMETNLGSFIGNFDGPNTLANMAVEGRRKSFAEGELIALIKLQESGEVARDDLVAGWAGAMGQTQFMPSTFLAHAVDFDGDGKKDLWNNPADALGSAANYLSISGYQNNEPWGLEVMAPDGFDWSLADGQDRRISTWTGAGLIGIDGGAVGASDGQFAELWLPTGATGPKYLLFKNFDVYKTYNRSDSYAFAVGLLTDGVGGKDGPITAWPTGIQMLNKGEIMLLQQRLNTLGFDAGVIDGIAGRGTRGALQRFQVANGFVADGYPSRDALDQVLSVSG